MADGTTAISGAAAPLEMSVPPDRLRHLAELNAWQPFMSALRALRICEKPLSRSYRIAGGGEMDAVELAYERACSWMVKARQLAERSAKRRVEQGRIEVSGRLDNVAAPLEKIEWRVWISLKPRKEHGETQWSGGNLKYFDLRFHDHDGVPLEQAIFAYSPQNLLEAFHVVSQYQDETAIYVAMQASLLDRIKAGRLLLSVISRGERTDVDPRRTAQLQWRNDTLQLHPRIGVSAAVDLNFPLVRPVAIRAAATDEAAKSSRAGVGGAKTKHDWPGAMAAVLSDLQEHNEYEVRGGKARLVEIAASFFAAKGQPEPHDSQIKDKVNETIKIHRLMLGLPADG